jgi:hypothetical protein
MIMFGAIGVVVGVALAQRFTVFVLAPVILVAAAGTSLIEIMRAHGPAQGLLSGLCVVLALQLGFLAGVFFRGSVGYSRQSSVGATLDEATPTPPSLTRPALDQGLAEMRDKLKTMAPGAQKDDAA